MLLGSPSRSGIRKSQRQSGLSNPGEPDLGTRPHPPQVQPMSPNSEPKVVDTYRVQGLLYLKSMGLEV